MSAIETSVPVAALARAGDAQTEAVVIADGIFMARDISNAHLVTTADGDVMVNTGFMDNAARTQELLAPHRTGPLRAIFLTQSHADHFGGVPLLKEPGTQVIAQEQFVRNMRDMSGMQAFFGPRTKKLWGSTLDRGPTPAPPPDIVPDVLFDREHTIEVGGRTFVAIWTPDGETTDAVTVWMPGERIAFTGNLFGPAFLSMPNLGTIRGDKPRLVWSYLASLERVRDLEPELLVTGHGDPIEGRDAIRDALDRMHAAVTWVRDYTMDGMKAGRDIHTLMNEVEVPAEIRIGELHGNVRWAVKTIWETYAGWFHYDSTTSLYGVPRSSVNDDLVELAGGAEPLAERARAKLGAGKPLEAIHLVDVVLGVDAGNVAALRVSKAAHEALLARAGGHNLSETMWLRSEIAAAERAIDAAASPGGSRTGTSE